MNGKLVGQLPRNERNETDDAKTDASFSEIYELIYYNNTLVRSELKVLELLIHNKMKNTPAASSKEVGPVHKAYKKQAAVCRT